jgi:uncharacterized membrane protein YtjA (UPF0391 family)
VEDLFRVGNSARPASLCFLGGEQEHAMLRWAAIFLVIALIAAVFGFTDIASASASIAQVLFSIFLILFLGAVILGIVALRRV